MALNDRQLNRARGRAYREWDETGSFEEYWAQNRQMYLAQARSEIRGQSGTPAGTKSPRDNGKATPDQMISQGNSIMKAGVSMTAFMILLPIVAVILIVVFSLMKTVLSA